MHESLFNQSLCVLLTWGWLLTVSLIMSYEVLQELHLELMRMRPWRSSSLLGSCSWVEVEHRQIETASPEMKPLHWSMVERDKALSLATFQLSPVIMSFGWWQKKIRLAARAAEKSCLQRAGLAWTVWGAWVFERSLELLLHFNRSHLRWFGTLVRTHSKVCDMSHQEVTSGQS